MSASNKYLPESEIVPDYFGFVRFWAHYNFNHQLTLIFDAEAQYLFELSADTIAENSAALLSLAQPSDRNTLHSTLETAINQNQNWVWEGKMIMPLSGTEKWISAKGKPSITDSTIIQGVFIDVTELKTARLKLLKTEELLRETGRLAKVGAWEIDLITMKHTWSEEVYHIHEIDPSQQPDLQQALEFFPVKYRWIIKKAVKEAISKNKPYDLELPFITAKGNAKWVRSLGNVTLRDGKAVCLYGVFQDITERKLAEEKLSVVYEFSTNAHILADETGIKDCNNAAILMSGYKHKQEIIGRQLREFSAENYSPAENIEKQVPQSKESTYQKDYHQYETINKRANGTHYPVEVTINAVTINHKPLMLVMWHDITRRRNNEAAIKRNALLLTETQQLTHSGSWEANLETGEHYWSDEAFRIFGLEPRLTAPAYEELATMIFPADRYKFNDIIRAAIKEKKSANTDLRIVLPTGEIRHIQAIGKPVVGENNRVKKLYGALLDITERKKTLEAIHGKREQLKALITYSPAAIAMVDKQMRYIATSNVWKKEYKLGDVNLTGKSHYDIFPDLPGRSKALHQKCMQGEILSSEEDSFISADGTTEWVKWEIRPWYEKPDEIGGIIMFTEVITARKENEKNLIKAKDMAEKAANIKSQFLSTMSHEIRTPMNAVIGFTHLLLENEPRQDQVEYLKILKFSGENLMLLINDILDFNKIEAGKIEFESISFNLRELVANLRASLMRIAQEKGIDIRLALANNIPETIIGDPVRLGQILTNLLSNAVKFTHEGHVTLSVSVQSFQQNDTTLHFSVLDTGIGIPADRQSDIFESFTQATFDTTRKYGGTGLGLTITKRLLELQDSEIQVESEPGKGSKFYFNLTFSNSYQTIAHKNKAHTETEIVRLKGKMLLIAEDHEMNRKYMVNLLNKWSINYVFVGTGYETIEALENNEYDAILMDVQMPELDGFETTARIRKLPNQRKASIPIIGVSASAMNNYKIRSREVGMTDFITKPFTPEELKVILLNYIPVEEPPLLPTDTPVKAVAEETTYNRALILEKYFNNDYEFASSFIQIFINETLPACKLLEPLLTQEGTIALGKRIHQLKTVFRMIGKEEIFIQFTLLEHKCANGTERHEIIKPLRQVLTMITDSEADILSLCSFADAQLTAAN